MVLRRIARVVTWVALAFTCTWRLIGVDIGNDGYDGWWPYLIAVGVASVVAWWGVWRRPRGDRAVAALIAAGITVSGLGDVLDLATDLTEAEAYLRWGEVFWLLSLILPCIAVGLKLWRSDDPSTRWGGLVDTLTILVVSGLIFFSLSIDSLVANADYSGDRQVILALYPVGDAVLLALVIRALLLSRGTRILDGLFLAGVSGWLLSDLVVAGAPDTDTVMRFSDPGFMAGSLLMGLSLWRDGRPGIRPRRADEPTLQRRAVFLVGLTPLVVPPALILINQARGREVSPWEPVIGLLLLLFLAYVRILGLVRELGRMSADLAVARDAAMEASRAKTAFFAMTSHEIRTPMNGVLGLAGLLAETDLDERQRQYTQGITSAGTTLLTVINDVLDFAKGEAGRIDLEEVDVDVAALVDEVASLVGLTAGDKDLRMRTTCAPDLPPVVRGDPTRLRQLLTNLAGNAVKFTDHGEIVISAALDPAAGEDEVRVRFEVSDTGIGIDPAAQQRLFEPFTQADASTTRRFGGTGLGLAICQQIVSAMGGSINVVSEVGRGSTFTVVVPFRRAVPTVSEPEPEPEVEPESGADFEAGSKGAGSDAVHPVQLRAGHRADLDQTVGEPVDADDAPHILVVDDDELNRIVAEGVLAGMGLTVTCVEGGRQALEVLASTAFDAVLMDCHMPEMSGDEVTRRWRDIEGTGRRTPIIAMTAGATDEERERCLTAGMDDFLTKPVRRAELKATLDRWMSAAVAAQRGPSRRAR